jgi:hypothetical protein
MKSLHNQCSSTGVSCDLGAIGASYLDDFDELRSFLLGLRWNL